MSDILRSLEKSLSLNALNKNNFYRETFSKAFIFNQLSKTPNAKAQQYITSQDKTPTSPSKVCKRPTSKALK